MANGMSLYELSAELAPLEEALQASGGDVTDQNWLMERVAELLDKTASKVDAYGMIYKNLEARAKAIKDEEIRLASRRGVFENGLKRLKEAAKLSMEMRSITKIEGASFTVAVQKNGGKAPVELLVKEDEVPDVYVRTRREVDMDALREDLVLGKPAAAAVARLGEIGTHVRIR